MPLHFRIASSVWLVSYLRAVARTNQPSAALSPPPKYYSDLSKIDKIELAQVLIQLEELVFMADEIAGEFPRIQRRWDQYYGQPGHSTAAELAKELSKVVDAATILDRAIYRLLVNHQACSDEMNWIFGYRTCSPHSHAVPYIRHTLSRFRNALIIGHPKGCDDEEFGEIFVESSHNDFQIGKELFPTWVGETRARVSAWISKRGCGAEGYVMSVVPAGAAVSGTERRSSGGWTDFMK